MSDWGIPPDYVVANWTEDELVLWFRKRQECAKRSQGGGNKAERREMQKWVPPLTEPPRPKYWPPKK